MTGEITLRGKVLPIGGLKEKVLAAHRAGIKTVILPARNSSDLEEIPPKIKRTMKFVPVDSVGEVLEQALISSPLKGTGVSRRRREGGASRNHDVQTPTRSEARGGGDRS
jgi:ATP-dependent Lon protease